MYQYTLGTRNGMHLQTRTCVVLVSGELSTSLAVARTRCHPDASSQSVYVAYHRADIKTFPEPCRPRRNLYARPFANFT